MKKANRGSLLLRNSGALKGFCHCVLFGAAYIFCCGTPEARAENLSSREYEIKAAYLYNFIKYVDWPSYGDTITIGVLGGNPFGTALAPLNGKIVKGRRLLIKELGSVRDAQKCQIIFVSSSEKSRLQEIFENLKSARVLTVGETQGFASSGGIINFVEENNKVRFEINADAARRTGLNISSELLKLAKLVKS
jgi:YfiR/HmsC-like